MSQVGYFFQYSTFASKRPQFQIPQTCFLPREPSNLVTPLRTDILIPSIVCTTGEGGGANLSVITRK